MEEIREKKIDFTITFLQDIHVRSTTFREALKTQLQYNLTYWESWQQRGLHFISDLAKKEDFLYLM